MSGTAPAGSSAGNRRSRAQIGPGLEGPGRSHSPGGSADRRSSRQRPSARVSLAWLEAQPAVTSVILGART
ncbi:hypothetical protein DZF96_12200, partial [Clavibacter michiganensis]